MPDQIEHNPCQTHETCASSRLNMFPDKGMMPKIKCGKYEKACGSTELKLQGIAGHGEILPARKRGANYWRE